MEKYLHKVQYYETDKMGITHHSNYIRFMEEARVDFMEQLGFGYDKMESMGIASPVVSVKCNYKKITTFPDIIEIAVTVTKIAPVKLILGYEMTVNGQVVCVAESTHGFLDSEGHIVRVDKSVPEFWECLKRETHEK